MEIDFKEFIEKYAVNYEIVRLRHQQGKTYKEIAEQFKLSVGIIGQRYRNFLYRLYRCYFMYLKSIEIESKPREVLDFYESFPLAIAYLEKTYNEHLDLFRHGVPPIMFGSYTDFPAFRKLKEEEILELEKKILKERENQKRTFSDIGKEFELSREKARWIYNHYYHMKVMKAFKIIRPTVDFPIEEYVFDYSHCSYKRWELIVREYAELVQDLMD